MGRDGLYTRLSRPLPVFQPVSSFVELPTGALVAARGHVVRVDGLPNGRWGVAVSFTTTRLLAMRRRDVTEAE